MNAKFNAKFAQRITIGIAIKVFCWSIIADRLSKRTANCNMIVRKTINVWFISVVLSEMNQETTAIDIKTNVV